MTIINDIYNESKKYLKSVLQSSDSNPELDARIIIMYALKINSLADFYLKANEKISDADSLKIKELIKNRAKGICTAVLIGQKDFYKNSFKVTSDTLVPRPETELLVEESLGWINSNYNKPSNKPINILDICTGTGCIGLSIANSLNIPYTLTLSDISTPALNVAKENAKDLKIKASFIKSDLFNNITGKFNIITANPPYISKDEYKELQIEVKNEPKLALTSPDDGYFHIKQILKDAKEHLAECSIMLIEIGCSQGSKALEITKKTYLDSNCSIIKDLAGLDRILKVELQN